MASIVMKQGLKAAFNAAVKDPNTLYYLTDSGEIFLGEKNMSQTNAHFTNAEAIASADVASTLAGFTSAKIGDTATLDIKIGESNITKKLSFVFDGEDWVALDQNYDAEEVFFGKDITITTAVGNITLTNGSGTIPAKGKNMKQVFEAMFTKETAPSEYVDANGKKTGITQPAVTISTGAQSKEIGTTVTPSWTASLSAGSYIYGPATGITATAWEISNNKTAETATTATGSFADFVVTEGNCYSVTAKATHGAGATPVSNLGNEVEDDAIAAGTKTVTKNLFSGYKPNFYGFISADDALADPASADATFLRALSTNQGATTTPVTSATASAEWKQFFYALPHGRKNNLAVTSKDGLPFTVVKVENVDMTHVGDVTSKYDFFYVNHTNPASAGKITLAWS